VQRYGKYRRKFNLPFFHIFPIFSFGGGGGGGG
jgi:hypothetical protein